MKICEKQVNPSTPFARKLPTLMAVVVLILSTAAQGDADLDLYIGSEAWEREDSLHEPQWFRRPEWDFPQLGIYQNAIFDDFDGDGDLDAYVTHDRNPLLGYENIGSAAGPIWKGRSEWDFLIPDIEENRVFATAFVDLNNDGRNDLTVAKHNTIRAYENVGGSVPARWQRTPKWDIELPGKYNLMHTFVDLDGDHDQDLLVRTWRSGLFAFENIGTINNPLWRERAQWAVLPYYDDGPYSLAVDDLDNDGDYDVLDARPGNTPQLIENIGDETTPNWAINNEWNTPSPRPEHWAGQATFVDIDSTLQVMRIGIEAHIDGRDQLIIQGDTLTWHHLSHAAVGRHRGANSPTIISDPDGNNVTEWLPIWPTLPPDELRREAFSSTFIGLPEPISSDGMQWDVVKKFGRDEVKIVEQPDPGNDYTLVVEFWDPSPGSRFYGIELVKLAGTGGDLDHDGDVDRDDVSLLLSRRNEPASGLGDPMDLDQDGVITTLDARKLMLTCTRPRCAFE